LTKDQVSDSENFSSSYFAVFFINHQAKNWQKFAFPFCQDLSISAQSFRFNVTTFLLELHPQRRKMGDKLKDQTKKSSNEAFFSLALCLMTQVFS